MPDEIWDSLASTWWEEAGFLHGLHTFLDPVRIPYIGAALRRCLSRTRGVRLLDVGCGGGLVAEALADLGCRVVGVDPSRSSIETARRHTWDGIRYAVGRGEELPFASGRFDAVVCSEVLEHVEDPDAVIAESTRVLRPGGVFVYSGPNRTRLMDLFLVRMAQEWRWTRIVPPGLHRWDRLLRPEEVHDAMRRHGLVPIDLVGVGLPLRSAARALAVFLALRAGRITHAEAGRRLPLRIRSSTALAYLGFGVRQTPNGLRINGRPDAPA